jgi:hypothetical protein
MFVARSIVLQPHVLDHEQPFQARHQSVKRDPQHRQEHDRHHHRRGEVERPLASRDGGMINAYGAVMPDSFTIAVNFW